MKKEELLEEAKRRYPNGTKFHSTGGNRYVTVIDSDKFIIDKEGDVVSTLGANASSRVYSKILGKWAEIVSLPKNKNKLIINKVVI